MNSTICDSKEIGMRRACLSWARAIVITSASIGFAATAMANNAKFDLVVSPGAQGCLPKASGEVTISPGENAERMHVEIKRLPPRTEFDVFLIQVPNSPFGMSWYQGDISTDANGVGVADLVGRFNEETFIVAPGAAPLPRPHAGADAGSNPVTKPVHTFHLGIWFNDPKDAGAAGCADIITPFNGEHNAGIQVLNTANFRDKQGPLGDIK